MTLVLTIYLAVGSVLAAGWTAAEFRLGAHRGAMLSATVFVLLWPMLAAGAAALALLAGRFDPDRGSLRRTARRAIKRPSGASPPLQPAAHRGDRAPRPSRASAS